MVPVVLSLVMAIIFRSPLALMMGVLGPLMVFGSWWDATKRHRRHGAQLETEHAVALEVYRDQTENARGAYKAQADQRIPGITSVWQDPLWRPSRTSSTVVRLGTSWWQAPPGHPLEGTGGIAAMPEGAELAHSLALVAHSDHEDIWRSVLASWCLYTAGDVQPPIGSSDFPLHGTFPKTLVGQSRVIWVSSITDVPDDIDTVLVVKSLRSATLIDGEGSRRDIVPDRLTQVEARKILQKAATMKSPEAATISADYGHRGQLWVEWGEGQPALNLVAEGPHAVVWGATGSGKSVTVSALVLSIARHYSPRDVVFVLIDFKGGAGVKSLVNLPHTIGVVTDLNESTTKRALAGINAEMLKRERLLASFSVQDCAELPDTVECPRLVLVIDEAAWLLTSFPAFSLVLSDALARGRSLGIHVIISTQRIAGVITPAMMANIALRVCGRVSDATECSSWLPELTTAQQQRSRYLEPGEVFVSGGVMAPVTRRVRSDAGPIGHPQQGSTWVMWAPELPKRVPVSPTQWALADDPQHQSHRELGFETLVGRSVLVIGDAHTGRSEAARTLASGAPLAMMAPQNPFALWLCLRDQQREPSALVIDDADVLLAQAGVDGAAVLLECLESFRGQLIMTSTGSSKYARSLSRLAEHGVCLFLAKPEVALLWDSPGVSVPGRARFAGETIQIAYGAAPPMPWEKIDQACSPAAPIVLTTRAAHWSGISSKFVGSLEKCLSQWHILGELLGEHPFVIDGYTHNEVRHASAGRIIVPPLPIPADHVVVWKQGVVSLSKTGLWQH